MARVLVIDDDDQIREMLRKSLELHGHEVLDAPNGKEGIELFNEKGADLVITDIIMPEKEGVETIKELRNDAPDLKIIAISGGGNLDPRLYLRLAEGSGAIRTFVKPFSLKELLNTVRELLDSPGRSDS